MSSLTIRRMALMLVLGLVLTSMPARVWLFGACPVCGQFHEKILFAALGDDPDPANPGEETPSPHEEDRAAEGCVPPLPYCSTHSVEPIASSFATGDELRPQSDLPIASLPASALIRPPRA